MIKSSSLVEMLSSNTTFLIGNFFLTHYSLFITDIPSLIFFLLSNKRILSIPEVIIKIFHCIFFPENSNVLGKCERLTLKKGNESSWDKNVVLCTNHSIESLLKPINIDWVTYLHTNQNVT